jgi:type III secretion protein N (ATPase)
VVRVHGDAVVAVLPGAAVGDGVRICRPGGGRVAAVVTGVERARVRLALFSEVTGIGVGDRVEAAPEALAVPLGFALLGRGIDAAGEPLDGGAALPSRIPSGAYRAGPPDGEVPAPDRRAPVDTPLWTGVRAIDGLLALGRGARVGIFGPPGAGKSSLVEAIVAGARADAVVLALIGERGREAARWLERLDPRTTIVCATSDRTPSERIRAAEIAMAQAVALRDHGLHVLIVIDSLARYAAALRERRIAAAEPAGRGGYPSGVWSDLARYVERAGCTADGSVTALATVLSESDDEHDPLAEAARSLLDGHVLLAADLANAGRFPAIDVLRSASRTMSGVVSAEHARAAASVRAALASLAATRDARELGFAVPPAVAALVACEAELEAFLRAPGPSDPAETRRGLAMLGRSLASAASGVPLPPAPHDAMERA